MCGIFGYVGERADVGSMVMQALTTLEYRGYDSWGVAVAGRDGIEVEKHVGKIGGCSVDFADTTVGFGHTRWATHGGVTDANAHPHLGPSGRVAVIHNGIVENFRQLKSELVARGHEFDSETDSEVIAHLVDAELVDHPDGGLVNAVASVFPRLDGLNAVIAFERDRRELVAAKNTSPLVIGANGRGATIASDTLALADHADRVLYLEDHHLAHLSLDGFSLYDRHTMRQLPPEFSPLTLSVQSRGLNGHPHFMAKEMAEQPDVLDRLVERSEEPIRELATSIGDAYGTFLVGCGTASYAALTGSYLFSRIAARHVNFVVGSEFRYHEHFLTPESLVLALSQSGETADVIDAMLAARRRGARLGALVNAEHSTLDRMVDCRVHLGAGPEQCVLSTKAYTAKVAVLLLAAHALAGSYEQGANLVRQAADGLRRLLSPEWTGQVREVAARIATAPNLFVIGRGLAYPTALEAALKIKEVSYMHAEGFAGGELKHGVIALVQPGTPCIVYAPNDETRNDILSGAMELRSRGGLMIGIGPEPDPVFDIHLATPDVGDAAPLVNALPAQMLGYHIALLRGNDPDKPRNLAKSVTVK
ncbi:MAG TPA: glutamine--fructose-6-phosphate transaminase (isomerizing) [Thermomicrobiales bacterium]|nr:glutamine--fructose-6-phosphate transaminase (isomerizing) [Thermomicrobiales bacterium]